MSDDHSLCLSIFGYNQNSSNETFNDSLETFRREFSYVVNGILTCILSVSGISFNLLCIYIFLKPLRRDRSPLIYYYLIGLELWDCFLLINAFLMYALPTVLYGRLISTGPYVVIYPVVYGMSNASLIGTVWTIITLTVDRYIALVKPLTHKMFRKSERVMRILAIVSICAIVYSIPRFFELRVLRCFLTSQNNSLSVIIQGELPGNQVYMVIYRIIGGMLFYSVGPFILLLVLTFRISVEISRASRRRYSMCNRQTVRRYHHTERSSQMMLLAVVIKFLCSHFMPTGLDIAEHVIGDSFRNDPIASTLVDVSNLLVVLNSSTNFLTYFACGPSFRTSFKSLIKLKMSSTRTTFEANSRYTSASTALSRSPESRRFRQRYKTVSGNGVEMRQLTIYRSMMSSHSDSTALRVEEHVRRCATSEFLI